MLAHGELDCLFHEPHTGFDDSLRVLQACLRKRMSGFKISKYLQKTDEDQLYDLEDQDPRSLPNSDLVQPPLGAEDSRAGVVAAGHLEGGD